MTDRFTGLFKIPASKPKQLYDQAGLAAELKRSDPGRYAELRQALKKAGHTGLIDFDRHVGRINGELKKAAAEAEKRAAAEAAAAQADAAATAEAAARDGADANDAKADGDGFVRNDKGQILPTQGNVRLAVEKLGAQLSYNSFQGLPIIEGLEGFGPTLDDAATNRLWLQVQDVFRLKPSLPFFRIVVEDACLMRRFHLVVDYLDGLDWDGLPRVDTWLVDYCGADDTPYVRAVSRLMLLAAVRRVRQPGVKFDEMLIMESPEGYDKSSALAALAVHDEWFTDSLPLNVDDKKMIEGHSGKWIVEIAELQGMRKGEIERVKAQQSRRFDRARLAYGKLPTEVPRQCVFFGTMNPPTGGGYLKSMTGNRRFWPVRVGRINLAELKRDRDEIWAEAVAREAQGESIRLAPELWPMAAAEQEQREETNPLVDVLARYLSGREGVLFSAEAWELTRIPVAQRGGHGEKFGRAMRLLGWERKKRRRQPKADQEWAYVKGDDTNCIEPAWESDRQGYAIYLRPYELSTNAQGAAEESDGAEPGG